MNLVPSVDRVTQAMGWTSESKAPCAVHRGGLSPHPGAAGAGGLNARGRATALSSLPGIGYPACTMGAPQLQSSGLGRGTTRVVGPEPDPGHATGGVGELWRSRALVWHFVLNDLRHRYTGSSIGFFWTVVTTARTGDLHVVFHGLIGIGSIRQAVGPTTRCTCSAGW